MKNYEVRYTETFFADLTAIVLYIYEKTENMFIARHFYEEVLECVEKRSFAADSYEPYYPYDGSPKYYRIYIGNYTAFYVLEDDIMDVRRILWSGTNIPEQFR